MRPSGVGGLYAGLLGSQPEPAYSGIVVSSLLDCMYYVSILVVVCCPLYAVLLFYRLFVLLIS